MNQKEKGVGSQFIALFMMSLFVISLFGMVASSASAYSYEYGNKQYYSIYYDNEGEAAVFSKFVLVNDGELNLDELTIEVPGNVNILNVIQEQEVRVYDEDYYKGYYTDQKYYDIDFDANELSDSVVVSFADLHAVKEGEELVLLVMYKEYDVAFSSLGVWNFEFETAKWQFDTSYIRVSSQVANGLYLKDIESEQNYRGGSDIAFAESAAVPSKMIAADESISDLSRSIEYSYGHVKEGYAFDSLESFLVTGKYSDSEFLLKLWRNVFGMMLAAVVLTGISVGLFKGFRVVTVGSKKKSAFSEVMLSGLLSAVIICLLCGLGIWLLTLIRDIGLYYVAGPIGLMLGLSLALFSLCAIAIPAVYLGKKHKDLVIGLSSVGVSIALISALSIIGIALVVLFA